MARTTERILVRFGGTEARVSDAFRTIVDLESIRPRAATARDCSFDALNQKRNSLDAGRSAS